MPASAWPGTVQRKVYVPGARSALTDVFPLAISFGDRDLLAVLLDRHVVFERRGVVEVDRDLARLAGQRRLVEGDLRRIGRQLERPARSLGLGFRLGLGGAFGFFGADRRFLLFGEFFAGAFDLGRPGFLLVLAVENREGRRAADQDHEPENDQGRESPGEVLEAQADEADHDRRDGEQRSDHEEGGSVVHAAGILSREDGGATRPDRPHLA